MKENLTVLGHHKSKQEVKNIQETIKAEWFGSVIRFKDSKENKFEIYSKQRSDIKVPVTITRYSNGEFNVVTDNDRSNKNNIDISKVMLVKEGLVFDPKELIVNENKEKQLEEVMQGMWGVKNITCFDSLGNHFEVHVKIANNDFTMPVVIKRYSNGEWSVVTNSLFKEEEKDSSNYIIEIDKVIMKRQVVTSYGSSF